MPAKHNRNSIHVGGARIVGDAAEADNLDSDLIEIMSAASDATSVHSGTSSISGNARGGRRRSTLVL
jgi:hypothetical protein